MSFWKTISVPAGGDGVAPRIQRSLDYMREHLDRPLQVAELAAQAGCSTSHYFTLFKRAVGCPPLDYFTRLRMRHACELLEQDGLSVKAAAARLGYDDPFYFSRVFKATCGVAPRDYRAWSAVRLPAVRRPAAPVAAPLSGTSTLAC